MREATVRVQFLGTGDAFGSGGRFQTCIYVQSDAEHFLIDCGASALVAMKRFEVDPSRVAIILLTHLHGDHFGGLPFFVLDAQFSRRTRPLVVAGPPGLERRIREAMEVLFPGSSGTPQRFNIEFVELHDRNTTGIGSLLVTPYRVMHASGAPAFALRVTCGDKTLAYSGDTEWTDTLIEAASGADLFICEAYYFEKKIKYHLDYHTLMEHRSQITSRRLILTHMNVDMLQHLHAIDVDSVKDGDVIAL